eukprot:2850391-Rhodomonas_salina.3
MRVNRFRSRVCQAVLQIRLGHSGRHGAGCGGRKDHHRVRRRLRRRSSGAAQAPQRRFATLAAMT